MGTGSSSQKDPSEEYKKIFPRKMTIHILSSRKYDCIKFVQFLTNENFPDHLNELLETDIKKKVNLYSFINYKIYSSTSLIIKNIKDKSKTIKENPENKDMIYSEIILVLNNENINYQVDKLKKGILKDEILSENYYMPFIIFLSRYNLDLSGFNKLKTFQYRIALQKLLYYDLLTKKK